MSNKNVAAKTAKKVQAPKPAKVAKPKKNVINVKAEAKFVSFKVRAVIPVKQYGNIQPEIEVVAPTYELAVAFAMPKIEELWKTYAERPINGNLPKFVGPVSVAEKTVAAPVAAPSPKAEAVAPASPSSTEASADSASQSTSTTAETPLSEAGQKGKKAIEAAATKEALDLAEDKIKNSVKIPDDEKPVLYTLILKKKKTL